MQSGRYKTMKRHIDNWASIVLILSIIITGTTGYLQSELELRRFVPHKYFAYTTLALAFTHLLFKWKKIVNYFKPRTRQ
ncbi:MAG: hypothetical protein A2W74_02255 [Planctomycetes bacterium RIFCSPLOWO2_12_38_17]|nr:MAG: hypothetical protein A2W74_02255 [Planctomycetes bacterium RIFCSPLOWO2_12_38_17]